MIASNVLFKEFPVLKSDKKRLSYKKNEIEMGDFP